MIEDVDPSAPSMEPLPPELQTHTPARDLERRLRGGTRYLRRREVARSVGVSLLSARKLWRALGFPVVTDEDTAFTDVDRDSLARAVGAVRSGLLDEDTVIALARALGQTTDRLVSWQTEALTEFLVREKGPDGATPEATIELLGTLAPYMEELLVYAWRRQLAAAVSRVSTDRGTPEDPVSAELTVGFADLVSYTRLSQRLDQRELGILVQRFEGLASDVVNGGGGRVVKTVGDEVLFTADDPAAGAVIALSLSEQMAVDDVVPDVRIGIAHGPVLRSLGDVYGVTVNLASRLTSLAQPGTVVTDPDTGAALGRSADLVLVPQRRRLVRGFGALQPLLVARAGPNSKLITLD